MKILKLYPVMAVIAVGVSVSGCGTATIEKGQQITLGPNEGIAAVVMDALNPLSQITFEGTDKGGTTIKIPSAPIGVTMYLFAVPAGHYCLSRYAAGMTEITSTDQENGDCFDVVAGKIAYSGNLAPRAFNSSGTWIRNQLVGYDIRTLQNFEWAAFEKRMQDEYPDLVAKYPIVTP